MAELRTQTRMIAMPLAVALACLATAPALGQTSQDERIQDDGTVTLDQVTVPLSSLMSEEARAFMRHIMLDKPFGTPVPDIARERERAGGIMLGFLEPMRNRYAVETSQETIGGVVVDVVTPSEGIAPENAHRVLINVHGGGFITGGRTASLVESVPLASLMKIKVISIDYRMGPEHQFPAASEDVANVYRELLKTYQPQHIGLYGCSAGGLLSAQSIAWFRSHELPRPAAVGVFCASLGAFFGGDASALAGPLNGMLPLRDAERPAASSGSPPSGPSYLETAKPDDPLAYPLASPEVMADFPPTLFISGTRSFEFSVALNSHNKLTQAGVDSRFHGWDGMNHAFFYNSELPESREAYAIMVDFFETHLAD